MFWWVPAKGSLLSSMGVTRNVSNSGVLIAASECPPVGAVVQVEVLLPRIEGNGYGMKLHGEGIVVRMETAICADLAEQPYAFAASVQFYPEQVDAAEQPS
jgi:hypothetical protein